MKIYRLRAILYLISIKLNMFFGSTINDSGIGLKMRGTKVTGFEETVHRLKRNNMSAQKSYKELTFCLFRVSVPSY